MVPPSSGVAAAVYGEIGCRALVESDASLNRWTHPRKRLTLGHAEYQPCWSRVVSRSPFPGWPSGVRDAASRDRDVSVTGAAVGKLAGKLLAVRASFSPASARAVPPGSAVDSA
jgi:hypothetical protein